MLGEDILYENPVVFNNFTYQIKKKKKKKKIKYNQSIKVNSTIKTETIPHP